MRIGIRADGGTTIGMGHIMRTLVLAKELCKIKEVFYICKSEKGLPGKYNSGIEKIRENGFEIRLIDESRVIEELQNIQADVLITDSYDVNEEYFNRTKAMFSKTGYIDDNNLLSYYNVDFLINQNLGAEEFEYKANSDTKLLLGSKYIMLREEFRSLETRRLLNHKVENIMITVGGTDPNCITEKLLDYIVDLKYNFHVVLGPSFYSLDKLKEIALANSNVKLYFNANMLEIMNKCDLAISACGSTLYELCLCEVPTLGVIVANNQERLAEKMNELRIVRNLGWYNKLSKELLTKSINDIASDSGIRRNMIYNAKLYIDNKGLERIIDNI